MVGLLVAASIIRGEEPAVRVLVSDYANVTAHTLALSIDAASTLLSRAGVKVEWVTCTRTSKVQTSFDCGRLEPLDIQLRILDEGRAKKVALNPGNLGYAVGSDGFGSIAAVFLNRATDLERLELASAGAILGAAIAHEIGHLLLAERGHATDGLMRAEWNEADLEALAQGGMNFSPSQAKQMSSTIKRRSKERNRRHQQ
jgi:hypothetical protein